MSLRPINVMSVRLVFESYPLPFLGLWVEFAWFLFIFNISMAAEYMDAVYSSAMRLAYLRNLGDCKGGLTVLAQVFLLLMTV